MYDVCFLPALYLPLLEGQRFNLPTEMFQHLPSDIKNRFFFLCLNMPKAGQQATKDVSRYVSFVY